MRTKLKMKNQNKGEKRTVNDVEGEIWNDDANENKKKFENENNKNERTVSDLKKNGEKYLCSPKIN